MVFLGFILIAVLFSVWWSHGEQIKASHNVQGRLHRIESKLDELRERVGYLLLAQQAIEGKLDALLGPEYFERKDGEDEG